MALVTVKLTLEQANVAVAALHERSEQLMEDSKYTNAKTLEDGSESPTMAERRALRERSAAIDEVIQAFG